MIFIFFTEDTTRKLLFLKWSATQPLYKLVEPIILKRYTGDWITIPEGTVTDGASVPWMLRWLFPQMGKYSRASLAHDYLYDNRIGTRADADYDFYQWMIIDGVPKWKAIIFYFAVIVGGKRWWNS
jgi:hypothetical protein